MTDSRFLGAPRCVKTDGTARAVFACMARKTSTGNARTAIAYIRASKDEQKLSPEAQRASIEAWAAREGVEVVAWHVDGGVCSATDIGDRPALVAALGELRAAGAGVLVVAKRDRLARDVYIAATIERAVAAGGARVASAAGEGNGETPADAFMRTVIDGAAQYEHALIRARTKAALAAKSARGERVGSVAYGHALADDGVRLVPLASERAVITAARQLRSEGRSLRDVATELTGRGMMSRTGRAFAAEQVARMVAV